MNILRLGEFGLINKISKIIAHNRARVAVGIGDDAAVIKRFKQGNLLLTCDMAMEGVHFSLKTASPFQVGYKAMASSISDIAAMGGAPRCAVVSLGVRKKISTEFYGQLYRGLDKAAAKFNVDIVGGDTVSSPHQLVLDVTIVGETGPYGTALRSGAKVGDGIFVTGDLGASAAGLYLLQHSKIKLRKIAAAGLKNKHLLPEPRVNEAQYLMKKKAVHAMMDISDGLASEIHHICKASGTGALLWEKEIPVSSAATELAGQCHASVFDWALYGGEEYELIFTGPFVKVPAKIGDIPISCIGRIMPRQHGVKLVTVERKSVALKPAGYKHF